MIDEERRRGAATGRSRAERRSTRSRSGCRRRYRGLFLDPQERRCFCERPIRATKLAFELLDSRGVGAARQGPRRAALQIRRRPLSHDLAPLQEVGLVHALAMAECSELGRPQSERRHHDPQLLFGWARTVASLKDSIRLAFLAPRRHLTSEQQPARALRLGGATLLREPERSDSVRHRQPLHHLRFEIFCVDQKNFEVTRPAEAERPSRRCAADATTSQTQGVNPIAYLTDLLDRIDGVSAADLRELLPDRWKPPATATTPADFDVE